MESSPTDREGHIPPLPLRAMLRSCAPLHGDAVGTIARAEGWCSIGESHKRELLELVEFDDDSINAMASHAQRLSSEGKITLFDELIESSTETNCFLGDEIAMAIRFGVRIADRNPIVSFWSMATLCSVDSPLYHEAKNYWLSAAASIVAVSRRRSRRVQDAYVLALAGSLPEQSGGPDRMGEIVELVISELILEKGPPSHQLEDPRVKQTIVTSGARLLASLLPYAVERDAAEIARGAFPFLFGRDG